MKHDLILRHELYKKVKNYVRGTLKKTGCQIQTHTLQLEVQLASGALRFALGDTDNSVPYRISETRLNVNDAFVCTHVGLFLKKETATQPGSGVLQTYPNSTIFTAEASYVALADLNSVWNSKLAIKVGDLDVLRGDDMHQTLFVPQTQQSASTNLAQRDVNDGFYAIEPPFTFEGQERNEITLKVPSWSGQLIQYSTAGSGATIYAVLKFRGFLITQGSGLAKAIANANLF